MGRISEVFIKFGKNVSIRGVPRIFTSRSICLKFLWIIAVLISTAVLLWQVLTLFQKYTAFPYKTINKEVWSVNAFPDITVCSLQPKLSGIDYEKCLTEKEFKQKLNNLFPFLTNDISKKLNLEISVKDFQANADYLLATYFNSLSKYNSSLDFPIPIIHKRILVDYLGSPITDDNCEFENYSFWDAMYHKCHTFHMKSSCKANIKGVTMIIFTNSLNELPEDDFEFNNTLTNGISLALTVPGITEDPFNRINLGAGTTNIINMVTTVRTRLDKPYTPEGCSNKTYLDNSKEDRYTRFTCSASCAQEKLLRECKCVSRLSFVPPYLQKFRVCGNTSLTLRQSPFDQTTELENILIAMNEIICERKIRTEELFRECELKCQEPCNSTYYRITVKTVGDWPYFTYHETFFKNYIKPYMRYDQNLSNYFEEYDVMISKYSNGSIDLKELNNFFKLSYGIRFNFLHLKLIFESEKVSTFVDYPEYPWESMISLVGGSFSLWLGITVMTAVEFLEFFFKLFCTFKECIISCKVSLKTKPTDAK